MIVFTYCCRKWYWYSTLYTNVEHSICKCPTGYFLNHLPTEITLQIFIGMSRLFFFRPRKPERSDLLSAQKCHLVFHLLRQTATWKYKETNTYLCAVPSVVHCRQKGWSKGWVTTVFSIFLRQRDVKILFPTQMCQPTENEYKFSMLLVKVQHRILFSSAD